jgi:N-acetylneuraminate synthase
MNSSFYIGKKKIGLNHPTYFIADIAANHDGNLGKALELINVAAESGADAAKFQHFQAETIVSDYGFKSLGTKKSHQSTWIKSVFEVYKDASLPLEWTPILKKECKKVGIEFFTSPYSIELVDYVNEYLEVYKVGSGDITWLEIIEHIAKKNKPIIIATGASNLEDVDRVINCVKKINKNLCIMQCNTNYTANNNNLKYINLNFLKTLKLKYKNLVLGLSDHTMGNVSVLGAITLGARIIEKHFTLSNELEGPDHKFSMTPKTWKEMINLSRDLEMTLGNGQKKIEDNERETIILQRRCVRVKNNLKKNHKILRENLVVLRPSPLNAIQPYDIDKILGKTLNKDKQEHEEITWQDLS